MRLKRLIQQYQSLNGIRDYLGKERKKKPASLFHCSCSTWMSHSFAQPEERFSRNFPGFATANDPTTTNPGGGLTMKARTWRKKVEWG